MINDSQHQRSTSSLCAMWSIWQIANTDVNKNLQMSIQIRVFLDQLLFFQDYDTFFKVISTYTYLLTQK